MPKSAKVTGLFFKSVPSANVTVIANVEEVRLDGALTVNVNEAPLAMEFTTGAVVLTEKAGAAKSIRAPRVEPELSRAE